MCILLYSVRRTNNLLQFLDLLKKGTAFVKVRYGRGVSFIYLLKVKRILTELTNNCHFYDWVYVFLAKSSKLHLHCKACTYMICTIILIMAIRKLATNCYLHVNYFLHVTYNLQCIFYLLLKFDLLLTYDKLFKCNTVCYLM